MFENKKDVLNLPSPPTWAMMEADLPAASSTDVIFSISKNNVDEGEGNSENEIDLESEKIISTVQQLHNEYNRLEESVNTLHTEMINTTSSVKALEKSMKHVKEQATKVKENA